jgi:hypothetical protein
MNNSQTMTEAQRLGEMGGGKRAAIILAMVVILTALIAILVVGFRGRHIARNAAALTHPVDVTTQPYTPRP